ncbi:MAG TPA: hypothetical protein VM076_18960 [Gemmatimonadaceae bacterium]|nr:hypothetical protein [Gemmatimonadaceae bacterium]
MNAAPAPRPVIDDGRRALRLEALGVALVVFAAYTIGRPDPVATLGRLYDDSVYLSLGKSIAEGTGYRSVHLVGAPVHVKFPPLLPAVYATAWGAFGTLDAVVTTALWLNILITSAAAGLLWWLARRELEVGLVPAALLCITPLLTARTMFYFSGAMGEPWLLLGWTAALLLVRHLERLRRAGASGVGTALGLGATLAAVMLARTQGVAVTVGIIGAMLFARMGRRAVATTVTACVAPLLVWNVWHASMVRRGPVSSLPDQTSYLTWIPLDNVSELGHFFSRVVQMTAGEYWRTAPIILIGWESPKTALLAATLYGLAALGVVLLARRFSALTGSVVGTGALLLVWPYAEDRFLAPVLPVLGLAAAYAVHRVLARVSVIARRVALAGAVLLMVAILGLNVRTRRDALRGEATSPFVMALAQMTRWVSANTAPTDNIMTPWGGVIYLRTGRRTSIGNPEEAAFAPSVLADPERFYASRLLADSVDIVVIWDGAPGRAAATLRTMGASCAGLLTETDQSSPGATAVHFYRVRRDLPCLTQHLEQRPVATPAQNKNAP